MNKTDLTKKSGVIYLGVFLLAVCGIATALMAMAKLLTDEPIRTAKDNKVLAGLKVVLNGIPYNNNPAETAVKRDDFTIYTAAQDGKAAAYVMTAHTGAGYGGSIEGLISFLPDRTIHMFIITKHNETPGIGTKVTDRVRIRTISDVLSGKEEDPSLPGNAVLDSFRGKRLGALEVTKGDGIHFVTGATVSSKAVAGMAQNASNALNKYLKEEAE